MVWFRKRSTSAIYSGISAAILDTLDESSGIARTIQATTTTTSVRKTHSIDSGLLSLRTKTVLLLSIKEKSLSKSLISRLST